MAVRLVTDSTSDLSADLANRWNVAVVPLYVNFVNKTMGGSIGPVGVVETLRDGVDISPDEFYRRLAISNPLPSTSQPSIQDFLDVYRAITEMGDDVISIHISSKLSGTCNSAVEAKKKLGGNAKIEIVDSGLASMGVGMAALAGARAIKKGSDFNTVLQEVWKSVSEYRLFFILDTLEYLEKGGRVGKAQSFLGSLLNIKAILTIQDGEILPFERVRNRNKALNRLVEIVEDRAPISELCIVDSTTPGDAAYLLERLSHLVVPTEIVSLRLGPTIGVHTGPGLVGVGVRLLS